MTDETQAVDVIAIHALKSGGRFLPPGSVVSIEDPEEAASLVERGAAAWPTEAELQGGEDASPEVVGLPEGVPGRKALVAAGINSVGALMGIEDLTSVDGISSSTAEAIDDWLGETELQGGEE